MEAVGTAVHFEDDAKITTPTRKRRDLDDFDDSERREKRARHVNEGNERGASTPAHLTFQDTVGGENINNVRPPSPESPTTSESMGKHSFKNYFWGNHIDIVQLQRTQSRSLTSQRAKNHP